MISQFTIDAVREAAISARARCKKAQDVFADMNRREECKEDLPPMSADLWDELRTTMELFIDHLIAEVRSAEEELFSLTGSTE
jgi:hypothetical protein